MGVWHLEVIYTAAAAHFSGVWRQGAEALAEMAQKALEVNLMAYSSCSEGPGTRSPSWVPLYRFFLGGGFPY